MTQLAAIELVDITQQRRNTRHRLDRRISHVDGRFLKSIEKLVIFTNMSGPYRVIAIDRTIVNILLSAGPMRLVGSVCSSFEPSEPHFRNAR